MKILNSPENVEIAITNRCNLRCRYCSHFDSAGDVPRELPGEEWLKFFEELKSLSVKSVTLQGGEPFFREDLKDVIEGIVNNNMAFSILSNGTLITDETAQFLAGTGKCSSVQVSIDGSIPTTHDAMRGKGSFEKAVNGLKALRKNGVNTTVRLTIHKENISDLEDIARFLLPWKPLCDDEALIVRRGRKGFFAHPFPTWSDYLLRGSRKRCDIQNYAPLAGVFFLQQAAEDALLPIKKEEAAARLNYGAHLVCNSAWDKSGDSGRKAIKAKLFNNTCDLLDHVPAYTLKASLTGKFWSKIESVL